MVGIYLFSNESPLVGRGRRGGCALRPRVLARAVLDVSSFNISRPNDNSCPYAGDNACDDSNGYRRSACEDTHGDARDAEGKACLETPNDDSCPYTGDNTCDEDTYRCDPGTDCTDCGNCGGISRCGAYDDDDFTSSSMCCACGGGSSRCTTDDDCPAESPMCYPAGFCGPGCWFARWVFPHVPAVPHHLTGRALPSLTRHIC